MFDEGLGAFQESLGRGFQVFRFLKGSAVSSSMLAFAALTRPSGLADAAQAVFGDQVDADAAEARCTGTMDRHRAPGIVLFLVESHSPRLPNQWQTQSPSVILVIVDSNT